MPRRRDPQRRDHSRGRRQSKRGGKTANPLALARALWKQQRFDEALRAMGEAVRQAPNDPRVLIEAARSYGHRYQIERTLNLLEKAQRLGKGQYAIQHAIGESYRLLGRLGDAESCFQRACKLASHPQSQLDLATIWERRHRLDEANELIDSALAKQPDFGAAQILQAAIARRKGESTRAESLLQSIIANQQLPPAVQAQAWGELVTLLDTQDQYDAAWDAALRCKQLLLPQAEPQWKVATFVLDRCRQMMDTLTPEHFQRWASVDSDSALANLEPKKVALLTGFPRSGTTLLQRVLDAHPQIVSTEERDLFATVVFPELGKGQDANTPIEQMISELSSDRILANREFYLSAVEALQGASLGSQLHIDKNPSMTLMIPSMVRLFPELKTIVALRDPRDVVTSCFLRYLPINPVSVCFLTLERTAERYLLDMGAWLKLREALVSDWIEVRYEEVVNDLQRTADRVLETLELPWDQEVLDYRRSQNQRPVQSPTYESVAKPIFSSAIGRWRHYGRHLAPMLDRLEPLLQAFGYDD